MSRGFFEGWSWLNNAKSKAAKVGFSEDSDLRRWEDLYVLLAVIYLMNIQNLWLEFQPGMPFLWISGLYLMDLNSCSVWQKSPRKAVAFLKTFTVFICIIRNLCFVFIVWIYWSLWTFCPAVSLGWGNHGVLFLFPGWRSMGYLCSGFK